MDKKKNYGWLVIINYISIILISILLVIGDFVNNKIFNMINTYIGFIIIILFILSYVASLNTLSNKYIKNRSDILWCGFSCLFIFLSILSINIVNNDFSNLLNIIGIIGIESLLFYLIFKLLFNKRKIIYSSLSFLLFIILGYFNIYAYTNYIYYNEKMFDSLMSLFSAIVGGSITLVGVVWTIKYEKSMSDRKEINNKLEKYSSLYFYNIDFIRFNKYRINKNIDYNLLIKNKEKVSFTSRYKVLSGFDMRISFKSNLNNVKNIIFDNVEFYINYTNSNKKIIKFNMINHQDDLPKISFIGNNLYQTYCVFISNNNKSMLDLQKEFFKANNNSNPMHMRINYRVINNQNVCSKFQLNMKLEFILQKDYHDYCDSFKYDNITNWMVKNPAILNEDSNK